MAFIVIETVLSVSLSDSWWQTVAQIYHTLSMKVLSYFTTDRSTLLKWTWTPGPAPADYLVSGAMEWY